MGLPEPLDAFIGPLEEMEIPYCVTGSVAAGVYGEPRTTRGIDLVLLLPPGKLARFQAAFPDTAFYIPPKETLVAELNREQRGSFNIIHHDSGFKADVYLAGRDPLHTWALQQRRRVTLGEGSLWLAPPEYVVLRKLEFLRESGLEKHLRDVRFMLSCTPLDSSFLSEQIQRLGLGEQWNACQPQT
jgi:hypothetical protein